MSDMERIVADNLRTRRREIGLTQKELAERLGYSEKAISKWERGNGMPPSAILPQLSSILGISIDRILCEQMRERYYLGIDVGGTKTEFLLVDAQGNEVRHAMLGCGNPSDLGLPAALEVLRAGILEVCGELPLRNISVFAGIAGGTTGDFERKIHEFLSRFSFAEVGNGSDAQNAIAAGLGGSDGIAVIMGTGSVAFAQRDGKPLRVGGYGYLFGDPGSGFAFGRDAILAALHDEDKSGTPTCLRELVLQRCGTPTVLESLGTFYAGGKRLIASYAPLLFEAYARGDAVAEELLRRNLDAVADTIRGAATYLDTETIPVVLCGGIASHHEEILPLLGETLGDESGRFTLSICQKPMVRGAIYLAGLKREESKSC